MVQAAEEFLAIPMSDTEITEKFAEFESRIAEEQGAFVLFALFMREQVPGRWDLIVSAPWLGAEAPSAVEYLVGQIKSKLGSQYLTCLSRIVVIDPRNVEVQSLNRMIRVEHGNVEVMDRSFFGLPVKRALFITSKAAHELAAV